MYAKLQNDFHLCLLCSIDSDSDDEGLVAGRQNNFRPTVDLKRFEQFVTEEENKPELPYTPTATDTPKPTTSHPLRNAKKVHKTTTNGSTAVSGQPKEKPMEASVDTSLPTVTDISNIDIDTAAGANDGDTVDSEMSNDMGSMVQASLKFKSQQQQDNGSSIKHGDDLKSVLNPTPLQQQQQEQKYLDKTKVCIVLSLPIIWLWWVLSTLRW